MLRSGSNMMLLGRATLCKAPSLAGTGFLSFSPMFFATGTVRQWPPGRRFGFIVDDESQKSFFCHQEDCVFAEGTDPRRRSINEGERVEFDLALDRRRNDGSQRCAKVKLVGGQPLPSGPDNRPDTSVPGEDPNADKGDLIGKKDVSGVVHGIARSFGFIAFKDDELRRYGSIFFHASSVMPGVTLRVGDNVVFDVNEDTRGSTDDGKKKVRAINVSKMM